MSDTHNTLACTSTSTNNTLADTTITAPVGTSITSDSSSIVNITSGTGIWPGAYITGPLATTNHVSIDKVENGYIINSDYRKYVFQKIDEALKFIGEKIGS